eukprot:gene12921-29191_t
MPSFFLGETAKYLYLLFDDAVSDGGHWALRDDWVEGGWVFSTEAHPFPVALFRRGAAAPRAPSPPPSRPPAAAEGPAVAREDWDAGPAYSADDGPPESDEE